MAIRSESILISERNLMYVIAGQLFDQAPNRQPRNAPIIMQKVKDHFRKDAHNDNQFYSLAIHKNDIYNYIKSMLMAISEFVDLNLSQIEYEKNISVNDENRSKYSFCTRYDKYDSESWKTDFIDLDAFIRNVHGRLLNIIKSDQDCFLCKKADEECKTCILNPEFKNRYESSREPKGQYTFSCKYNCKCHYQICCEECKDKNTCDSVCDGKSDTCGNKVLE